MALLLLLFLVLPIAELYVIIQVGQAIGVAPTLALLLVDGFIGAALARSQGRAAWERFNRALSEGRVPARETFDGAMIILGGALLLTPGFITDVFGIFLLVPPTRAVMRAAVARLARRRVAFARTVASPPPRPGAFGGRSGADPRTRGTRSGAGTSSRTGGFDPRTRPRGSGSREYDVEGSAREITDPAGELPEGRDD